MKTLWEGLFKQNPVFVLFLGLVPAVAISITAQNGWILGGISATILVISGVLNHTLISLVPKSIRPMITVLVVVVLTVMSHALLLNWQPQIVAQLGIFLPLIVANSLVLQAYDEEQGLGAVALQTLGQGLGFILALVVIGAIREFLGLGTVFGARIITASLPPLALANSVPGGLIIVGLLLAVVNKLNGRGGELHD